MQTIINILVFVFILGFIVTIHEFGHFIAAKFFNVYCGAFSIGMGPKIYGKKGKETEFEIRALPIGGFVSMAGEADQEENEDMKDLPLERTLKGKKTYQKVIIFLAGVFMNFVLAIIVMLGVNFSSGVIPVNNATIGQVMPDTAADIYGLKSGDVITNIEVPEANKSFVISSYEDIPSNLTKESLGVTSDSITLDITVTRDNQSQVVKVVTEFDETNKKFTIGITQATRKMNFVECIREAFVTIGTMSVAIFDALKQLVLHFSSTVTQLSGPVGIYQITSQVTESGQISYLFYLLALLSTNIGIFNLLPIPGLDGCQVIFAVIEGVIQRELPIKVKYALQFAGLALVMLLMVFVTYQDIIRLLG